MEFTSKQKAFLEFIPVSNIRKTVINMYVFTLFLIPMIVSYYYKNPTLDYQLWRIIISFDIVLIIISIPILIKPKIFIGLFHVLIGIISVFASLILFISYIIESDLSIQQNNVNLIFSIVIYIIALLTENILIIRTNFLNHPKSNNKITSIIILAPIAGMIVYNVLENTFKVNGMAIAAFLLAVGIGIPIHSLYRGYIVLKYKYKPSDL